MFQTKSSSSTSFRDATLDGEIVEKQDPDRNKAHALTSSQIGLGERRELPLRAGREARRAKSVVPPREKHGEAFPEVPSEVLSATGVEKGSMRIRLDGEAGAGRDVIFRATTVVVQWPFSLIFAHRYRSLCASPSVNSLTTSHTSAFTSNSTRRALAALQRARDDAAMGGGTRGGTG
uniref:Uncharacterized protein n=1 Tax=Mycena chlorophos TaxID=658473 RepID=A0ABQ0L1N1_MYCCL|nr:predicted protein [Mycena chlorophos]